MLLGSLPVSPPLARLRQRRIDRDQGRMRLSPSRPAPLIDSNGPATEKPEIRRVSE
jgi:hypothetical protein